MNNGKPQNKQIEEHKMKYEWWWKILKKYDRTIGGKTMDSIYWCWFLVSWWEMLMLFENSEITSKLTKTKITSKLT